MISSIFKAFKNFLGFDTTNSSTRKRPHQDAGSDYNDDISTDEETDFENLNSVKRRKLEFDENPNVMANWIKTSKGISQTFSYKKVETSRDNLNGENLENLFITPKLKSTEKNPLASDSQSSITSHHSDFLEFNGGEENDENKFLKKRTFSDSHSKLGKNSSQRPLPTTPFVNGSYHGHLPNQKCDSDCQLKSISPNGANSSKRLTVSRCSQIQEKEKYRQLLNRYPQPFIPVNGNDSLSLRHSLNHSVTNSSSSFHKNSVIREKLDKSDREKQIQNILQSRSSSKQKQNINYTNGTSSRTTPDSFSGRSSKLGKTTNFSKTNGEVNQSTSKQPANEAKKWKLKSDELNCPYTDKMWLEKWKIKLKSQDNERRRQITEARKRIDALTPPWEKDFRELEKNIQDQLSIAEKQSEVLEEIYSTKDLDKDLLDDDKKPMPELTPEMEKKIDDALKPKPPNEVLVDKFQIPIHRRDMETLQDLNWLNDAIINFYMNLLMERGKLDNMPSVYACNTFFYPKLINGGHAALKRWTRKIDIFSYDIMLVPVHLEVHWCLAVVDFRMKMIKYYDSMGGKNNECLNALSTYLQDESLDKKKQTLSMDDWNLKNVSNAPKQKNSSDCGMFACKYAEYITRDAKLTFKQHHMPYFRRRMVYEILTTQLL